MDRNRIWSYETTPTKPPPLFGSFFEGWSFGKGDIPLTPPPDDDELLEEEFVDADDTSFSSRTSSTDLHPHPQSSNSYSPPVTYQPRRKSSIQVGNQVMTKLLQEDNVKSAIEILQQALNHLDMAQQEEAEDKYAISKIYSKIIKSLCDPTISKIVDEMTPGDRKSDIHHSVLWRLFTKVVESGHVLQTDAHLAVVNTLVDKGQEPLALQAMYTLPRKEWDTSCYRTAVLLHLMQHPKQIIEAQKLLSDYGKPYLEIANPTAPNDLPPLRIAMPLMTEITENDQFKLWMLYQAALSRDNDYWTHEMQTFEAKRKEALTLLEEKENDTIDWALEQFNIETEKLKVDRKSTESDNTMIYIAMNNNQFEYAWQVYLAMADAVNESTPCIVMHLCWVAFRQIPIADVSYRTDWETRAWSVYSRFMCSEYLHPDQPEAPSFLHDILSIATHTPEVSVDKKTRYTKAMSIYNLLSRLHFDKLLCDDRVIEPLICIILYECKGTPMNIVSMCQKAFEIIDRKNEIVQRLPFDQTKQAPYSIIWGLLILCLKSGDETHFQKVLTYLLHNVLETNRACTLPSSILAPIQEFHDLYTCNRKTCYFQGYMFRYIRYTDDLDNTLPIDMNAFGFLSDDKNEDYNQQLLWRSNIREPQEPDIAMAILMGAALGEKLVQKQMYFSTKKAKALIRHARSLTFSSDP
ncbi:hypothetical protein EDC94DRAFT_606758 [Helicostylum pulchrum]|nr:hypothetical protein EDC94DRAFT_606758 [Helicostylum pulchrum]